MRLLDWASERLLTSVVLLVVCASVLAVSLAGVAGWFVLAVLTTGGTGALGTLLPLFVVGVFLSLPLTALAGVLVAVGIAARASSAVRGDRARQWASYIERESSLARAVGLSSLVERFDTRSADQRADDRVDGLKRRYVEGDISESEFERRTREILDQEGVDRERSSVINDRLRESRREKE